MQPHLDLAHAEYNKISNKKSSHKSHHFQWHAMNYYLNHNCKAPFTRYNLLSTGYIVFTNIQPVVKPVWQTAVSCIQPVVKPAVQRGLTTGCSFKTVVKPCLSNRLYNPVLTTGWTNSGCSFNTVVQQVVQRGMTTFNTVVKPVVKRV